MKFQATLIALCFATSIASAEWKTFKSIVGSEVRAEVQGITPDGLVQLKVLSGTVEVKIGQLAPESQVAVLLSLQDIIEEAKQEVEEVKAESETAEPDIPTIDPTLNKLGQLRKYGEEVAVMLNAQLTQQVSEVVEHSKGLTDQGSINRIEQALKRLPEQLQAKGSISFSTSIYNLKEAANFMPTRKGQEATLALCDTLKLVQESKNTFSSIDHMVAMAKWSESSEDKQRNDARAKSLWLRIQRVKKAPKIGLAFTNLEASWWAFRKEWMSAEPVKVENEPSNPQE